MLGMGLDPAESRVEENWLWTAPARLAWEIILGHIQTVAVRLTPDAQRDLATLPVIIRARARKVLARLEQWPDVSGAKPMHGNLVGHFRIRTGDFRVLFRPDGQDVIVLRIRDRKDVYDD